MAGFGFGGVRLLRTGGGGPPQIVLDPLFLSDTVTVEGDPQGTPVGTIGGTAAGSTVTLIDNAGGRFQLNGLVIEVGPTGTDYEASTVHSIGLRETLAEAVNPQNDTVLQITVANRPEVTLSPLTGTFSLPESALEGASAGALSGMKPGSAWSLIDTAGGRVALSGANVVRGATALNYEAAASHPFTVRETHPDAPAPGYLDTTLTLSVTNVPEQPALAALSLSAASVPEDSPATINILGATPGSVITVQSGALPPGMTLNSAARTLTGTPPTPGVSDFVLREALTDSPTGYLDTPLQLTVQTLGEPMTARFLLIGGGGSGRHEQYRSGGGGGAGRVLRGTASVLPGTYPVVVGLGGPAGPTASAKGGDSSALGFVAPGGGFGGLNGTGVSGGSGGGAGAPNLGLGAAGGPAVAGTGQAGEGFPGGQANSGAQQNGYERASGGGGGAGGPGEMPNDVTGVDVGNGGPGIQDDISGTLSWYAAGGGGGSNSGMPSGGAGGQGGGGSGGKGSQGGGSVAVSATSGTTPGSGGGGSSGGAALVHGGGAAGIFIYAYQDGTQEATGGTVTNVNGYTIHTFTENGDLVIVAPPPPPPEPTLTNPTATPVGETGATGTVDSSADTGTLYPYVSASATPPGEAEHLAGTDALWMVSQAVTGAGTQTVTITGLNADGLGGTFYIHYRHEAVDGAVSGVQTASFALAALGPMQSSVTQNTVTFTFSEPRPVAQYADGSWAVQAPVTIISMTPESTIVDGTYWNDEAYTGRRINGAVVNPGNRVYAPAGQNSGNSLIDSGVGYWQGWDSLQKAASEPNDVGKAQYDNSFNKDPGNVGAPLAITTPSSVVKAVSQLNSASLNPRSEGFVRKLVVLTVVDTLPQPGDMRPGTSGTDKTSPFNIADVDLSVFQNLTPVAGSPAYADVYRWVRYPYQVQLPDTLNVRNINPSENMKVYPREIGWDVGNALLFMHYNITPQEKMDLFVALAQIGIDSADRIVEGGRTPGHGGGNGFKHSPLAVTLAALGASAPAWLVNASNLTAAWGEDNNAPLVDAGLVAETSGKPLVDNATSFPQARFQPHMIGAADWGRTGSNYTEYYLDIAGGAVFAQMLGVKLTQGGEAAYNYKTAFDWYIGKYWHYQIVHNYTSSGINRPLDWHKTFSNAYRPVNAQAPTFTPYVKEGVIRLVADNQLDEWITLDPAVFSVTVNGAPATFTLPTAAPIYSSNVGLLLDVPVTSTDEVRVSYAQPATNRIASIDGVAMASFSNLLAINQSPSVGGANPAYPRVLMNGGRVQHAATNQTLGPNAPTGTLFIEGFRLRATPGAASIIFGMYGNKGTINVSVLTNRKLQIFINDTGGRYTLYANAIPLDTDLDILIDWDVTQSVWTDGFSAKINGVQQRSLTGGSWYGGAGKTVNWSKSDWGARYNVGGDGTYPNAEIGGLWLDTQNRVTDPAQVAKLTSKTNGALDIGTLGDGVNGQVPEVFLVGNASQWNDPSGINRGDGHKFFKVGTGTGLTDVIPEQNPWV